MATERLEIEIDVNTSKLNNNLQTVARDTKKALDPAKKLELELNVVRFQTQLQDVRRQLKAAADTDAQIKLRLQTNELQRNLTEAKRSLNNFLNTGDQSLSRLQQKFNGIGEGIKSAFGGFIGGAAIATGVYSAAKAMVTLASNLEQAKIAFTTMLGSAEKADTLLRDLSEFAKKTPFELTGIRENAKQLLAMGVAQENVLPTLKALGDVAAGLSVPLERLTLAYGQVLAKGRLTGGELRQFTEAGVDLLPTLSQLLGKSTAELSKMVEQGKITATDVTKAFEIMTSEGGKFANLGAKQAETLQGKWSNLVDSVSQLGEKIGTQFLPTLTALVDGVSELTASYGETAGSILADFTTTIGKIFTDFVSSTNGLFNELNDQTNKAEEEQITFGKVVLFILNAIVAGLKTVVFALKSVGKFWGTIFYDIVTFSGDAIDVILSSFVALGKAGAGVFKKLGYNIGVAINNGIAKATATINDFIKWVNDKVGTSFGTISGPAVMNYGDFSDNFTRNFKGIGDKVSKIGAGISDSFVNLKDEVTGDFDALATSIDASFEKIKNSGKKAAADTKKEIGKIDLSKISNTGKEDAKSGGSAAAKELKDKQKALEAQAMLEIQAVKNSVATEEEKAKKILEINKKLEDDVKRLKGDNLSLEKEAADEILRKAKQTIEERKKRETELYDSTGKKISQNLSDIEKLTNEYGNLKNKLKEVGDKGAEEIQKIQDKINELRKTLQETISQGQIDLGARYVEVQKEIVDKEKEIQELNANQDYTKASEAQAELNKLKDEALLITQNTTEEERKKAAEQAAKSPAQLILDEIAAKKAKIEEDIKNAETEKTLEEKKLTEEKERIQSKLDAILAQINAENEAIKSQDAQRRQIEQDYTAFFGTQIDARKAMLEELRRKAEEAAAAIKSAGISGADLAQSAANSGTTINQNVQISSNLDGESFLRDLNSKIK